MLQEIFIALGISFLIQCFFFGIALWNRTDKVTDLSYGLSFIVLALWYGFQSTKTAVQIIGTMMVVVWGMRIALYLFIRILRTKKDARFDTIRTDALRFGMFWLLQAFSVWMIMLPSLVLFLSFSPNLTPFAGVGVLLWLFGIVIEAVADMQKFQFKNNPANKGKWVDIGLWRYSRHPNYFGEMLCWWGIFIMVWPYLHGWLLLSIAGPLTITILLLFVSGIPLLEKRHDERYQGNAAYEEYKKTTSLLIPFPKR